MRYVVVSQNDQGVRVFGTFRDRDRAEALAARVNKKVEAVEDREFAEWHALPHEEKGMAPDGYGRAGVLIVHKPSVARAFRFALGELDS